MIKKRRGSRCSSQVKVDTIFVTVGSTEFPELIDKVVSIPFLRHLKTIGCQQVIIQRGRSRIDEKLVARQRYVHMDQYDYKSSILEDIERADLVVGHAGAGTCLEVLRRSKRLVVVANESLMDNHQGELANQLLEDGYARKSSVDGLENELTEILEQSWTPKPFPAADPSRFSKIFEDTLEGLKKQAK